MMAAPATQLWAQAISDAAALRPFQERLNGLPTAAARKAAIIDACCQGLLTRDDTQMLFDVYDLATA